MKQLLQTKKTNRDNFIDQSVQTFNSALKAKETQTYTPKQKEIAISATEWDIYDSYNVPLKKKPEKSEIKEIQESSDSDQKPSFNGQVTIKFD